MNNSIGYKKVRVNKDVVSKHGHFYKVSAAPRWTRSQDFLDRPDISLKVPTVLELVKLRHLPV